MMKIEGSGSGSISQRHGSADPDPDPHQNVMDPQHCRIHNTDENRKDGELYNVQEAHEKGAVLYLLDMFCNNDTPGLRERTAEVSHTVFLYLIFHQFKFFTYNTE